MLEALEAAGDWAGVRQLHDLRNPATDHTWLWSSATTSSKIIRKREFALAVRLRLGADILQGEVTCACCGELLDSRCFHALRCAPGESTRGHNWVSHTLLDVSSLADSASVAEPRGIVPSRPGLRPADLLSSAVFGRPTALDVTIVCPDSEGAGPDPCTAAIRKKRDKYASVLEELREEGIEYKPLAWSCWGRPDGDSVEAVGAMAAAAARRRGLGDPRHLARRTAAQIGAQIWRRAACMVTACLPDTPVCDLAEVLPVREEPPWGGPPGTASDMGRWLDEAAARADGLGLEGAAGSGAA